MAKLVGVCRTDGVPMERRQFPLSTDDTLGIIIQFPDMCVGCRGDVIDEAKVKLFVQKYTSLSTDQISRAVLLTRNNVVSQLQHNIDCVGCRRSVEKLFEECAAAHHRAMEPMIVSRSQTISILPDCLTDARSMYSLLYIQSSCSLLDVNSRTRKGKRCALHSIDSHKTKAFWSWTEIWDLASQDCREEITLVDCDSLHVTLDEYLRKHRFCADCKNKVTYAFRILTKEADGTSEKTYCAALYDGIKVCDKERHIHVHCEEKFIGSLLERAEPELAGNQREQHAKTIDVAQEEVLTCLGIYLHDRFFRLLQKLRVIEKSWIILYSLTIDALRRNIEAAFERKLGDYSVEHIMQELVTGDDQLKTPFKQNRRKKKKVPTATLR